MEKIKREMDQKTIDLLKGLERAYEKMVAFKKYKKTPLVVSKNGVIVEIPYDEIKPTTSYFNSGEIDNEKFIQK